MAHAPGDGDELLSSINVTPLVDVLLVLLLVLMVSASAAVARSLNVNLPEAASGENEQGTLSIQVDARGAWLVGERLLSREALSAELSTRGDPAGLSVLVAADGAAEHRHVVALLDTLRQRGVVRVAFAVNAPEAQ